LKLLLFNVENFFLTNTVDQKPVEKTKAIAEIVKELSPDIIMFCEVGGFVSLDLFTTKYLQSQYLPFLLPGNSDRGIEIGYLIKKTFPYTFNHISHVEKPFSRDVSELLIYKNKTLQCIILLVHLKSKWDREGNDPQGFLKRSQEVETLITLFKKRETEFPSIPIIIAGDFNGVAQKNNCSIEFRQFYELTPLEDILEILNLPNESRTTYCYFSKEGKADYSQLDYIFIPPVLFSKVVKEESGIYLFKDPSGLPYRLPQSTFERFALPSDHYPLVLTLDFLQ
jgi:hypothetical protein